MLKRELKKDEEWMLLARLLQKTNEALISNIKELETRVKNLEKSKDE